MNARAAGGGVNQSVNFKANNVQLQSLANLGKDSIKINNVAGNNLKKYQMNVPSKGGPSNAPGNTGYYANNNLINESIANKEQMINRANQIEQKNK